MALSYGEAVHVGELGWLELGNNLWSLEGVLRPPAHDLEPGGAGEALLEGEVDRVISAWFPHPVGAAIEGHGVGGGVLHVHRGQVRDVKPGNMYGLLVYLIMYSMIFEQ